MLNDKSIGTDTVASGLIAKTSASERGGAGGVFTVTCFDKDGNLKWETTEHNLVVNEGLQNMNNVYLGATSKNANLFLGLITGPGSGTTFATTDTLASKSWTEYTNYSGSRPAVTFGTASNPGTGASIISNSASPSSFSITGAGGTVAGAFLCTVASGPSGILFSESDFQSPGDRVVVLGDTLNVTYTFTLTAA
jgi:hypothetical protein